MRETVRAAAFIGLIVVLMYGDIVFFGFTLSPALVTSGVLTPPYGYSGRWILSFFVMDPLASGGQSWPVYELIGRMLASGQLPLWDPFQGTGIPLAASLFQTYFPFDLLHAILPNQFWDFIWLSELWCAGVLAYLLLKRLGVGYLGSIAGGLAYALSGGFIFYPFLPWADVAIMTPALLLAVKFCFDRPLTGKAIVAMAAASGISLLGAHLETLVIQALFVGLFVLFETASRKNYRGLLTCFLAVLLGFALTTFYWLPILEYLRVAATAHGAGEGVHSLATDGNPAIYWLTLFVPYFYGFLQTYPYEGLRQVFFWDISPGYVGAVVFFLSLIPLLSQGVDSFRRNKYYLFFILAEALILMKIFGVPPVNWIGYLPVLTFVIFSRYSGSFLALSFAGACGLGLEAVVGHAKYAGRAFIVVLIALLLAVGLTVPFPASPASPFFWVSLAYLALAIFYLVLSTAVSHRGGKEAGEVLLFLIILELVSYIPRSLPTYFEALRVSVLAAGALFIVMMTCNWLRTLGSFVRLPIPRRLSFSRAKRFAIVIVVIVLVSQMIVSSSAPSGPPNRYDVFTVAPYVRFLEANVGYQRVYSLDGTFFPPVAGVYSIQNLGEFSALMPSSFETFSQANLDRGATAAALGAFRNNAISSAASEVHSNLAFYSLLGVKYFITTYTDLSTVNETLLQPETEGSSSWAPLGNNSVSTNFLTDTSFDGVLVRIGTYDRINHGDILLTLDGTLGNATILRVARLPAESILNGAWENVFTFPEIDVAGVAKFRLTLSQSDTRPGNEVAVMWWPQVKQNPDLSIVNGSLRIAMGLVQREESLSVVYRDQNATIFQNLGAFPRTFFTDHVMVAENEEDAVLKTRDLGWNTRENLVIEGDISTRFAQVNVSKLGSIVGSAEIEQYSPSEVTIRVEASRPSFLVLTDTFYPGWQGYIDGNPEKIYRAYGLVKSNIRYWGVSRGHIQVRT